MAASRSSPQKLAFIDRIVADSRDVALNHRGPFASAASDDDAVLAATMDEGYQACIGIVKKRVAATLEGWTWLDRTALRLVLRSHRPSSSRKHLSGHRGWMKANVHRSTSCSRLAADHGIVLLSGGCRAGLVGSHIVREPG
jgi:aspartate 4-decarboxylase